MDLISSSEHLEIRAAMQDLADTFHKSTILYKREIDSLDKFNEDRADTVYQEYTIPCMVEYTKYDRDKVSRYTEGAISKAELMIQILYDNLVSLGLTANNTVIFNQTVDKLIHKGKLYFVKYVGLEGPMEDRNILVTVYADPEVDRT